MKNVGGETNVLVIYFTYSENSLNQIAFNLNLIHTKYLSIDFKNYSTFFFLFFFLFVVNFVIHWNETAMGLQAFPILIPPPTSLSTRFP